MQILYYSFIHYFLLRSVSFTSFDELSAFTTYNYRSPERSFIIILIYLI